MSKPAGLATTAPVQELPTLDVSRPEYSCVAVNGVNVGFAAKLSGSPDLLEYQDMVDALGGEQAAAISGLSPQSYVALLGSVVKSSGSSFNVPSLFSPSSTEALRCQSQPSTVASVDVSEMD